MGEFTSEPLQPCSSSLRTRAAVDLEELLSNGLSRGADACVHRDRVSLPMGAVTRVMIVVYIEGSQRRQLQ